MTERERIVLLTKAGAIPFASLTSRLVAVVDSKMAGSKCEIAALKQLCNGGLVVVADGNLEDIRQAARHQGLAHFACHARSEFQRPFTTTLEFGDAPATSISIDDIMSLDLSKWSLAVLGACRTIGAEPAEMFCGRIDMASAFLAAGVRRVIAGTWPVDDLSTSIFMELFWRTFWGKYPDGGCDCTACALHRARMVFAGQQPWPDELALRIPAAAREEWKHPYYWASFRLMGAS
jgi:CHAT domain-containing protein